MITDATLDDQLIKILKRIDVVLEKAEGPRHSEEDVDLKIRRPEVPPSAAEWRQRIEAAILGNPGLRPAEVAEIAKVTVQTIKVYRKRMKDEGRL